MRLNFKKDFNEWRENSRHSALVERAEDIFQVTEYKGEFWFLFNRCLICPCSMMKDAPIDALQEMRRLYVERNK